MRKPKYLWLVFVFAAFLSGCSKVSFDTKDLNNDGEPDIWIYKDSKGIVVKTEVLRKRSGRESDWYFWSKDGRLIKEISTSSDGKRVTFYQTNYREVNLDGRIVWQSEVDLRKAYPKETYRKKASRSFLYAYNNELILAQHDDDQDGKIDRANLIKDFRTIDKYRGPYKGSIQELQSS